MNIEKTTLEKWDAQVQQIARDMQQLKTERDQLRAQLEAARLELCRVGLLPSGHTTIEEAVAGAQHIVRHLRKTIHDPPPDIQEAVIRKLNLVSADALEADKRYAEIGRKWLKNSSLEEWFPITAKHLAKLEKERDQLKAEVEKWKADMCDVVERAGAMEMALKRIYNMPNGWAVDMVARMRQTAIETLTEVQ